MTPYKGTNLAGLKFTADWCLTWHGYRTLFGVISVQIFFHCFEPQVGITENVPIMQIGHKLISFEGYELGLFMDCQIHRQCIGNYLTSVFKKRLPTAAYSFVAHFTVI